MPELAEVFYYSKQWDEGLHKEITRVKTHPHARIFRDCHPSKLCRALQQTRYLSSQTHGKKMLFRFSQNKWLLLHLGMTGKLSVEANNFKPGKHDHLVLYQKERALVFHDPRMFGKAEFYESTHLPLVWKELPPEILSSNYTREYLLQFLQRHPKTRIKTLLLNQSGFPGIGNWMADEILWKVSLHPQTLAGKISEERVEAMRKVLINVCRGALRTIGECWGALPRTWLFPHRWKKGGNCPRCHSVLVRESIHGRTSCWCAQCQK